MPKKIQQHPQPHPLQKTSPKQNQKKTNITNLGDTESFKQIYNSPTDHANI